MAIADKLTKLANDITNAYEAIDDKGGTIPANKNTDNLENAIRTIQTGATPTGTKQINITQNGTTTEDVTNYANAQITTNVVNQDYEDALVAFGVQSALADSIEALTTYSNEVTGESDTTLSDAVRTLADGFGHGGAIYLYESKHITTDASYNTFDNFKNAVVPDLPLDKTCVIIEFINNTTTSRSGICWMQCITPETGEVSSCGLRVGAAFGGNYGCDVHAGATINIYVGEHGALPSIT